MLQTSKRLFYKYYKDLTALISIFSITLVVFSNLFRIPFIADDFDFIFTWNDIKNFSHIPALLLGATPLHHEGVYRPIRGLFYVFSYHFGQQNLLYYHLQELVIYGICIILIYFITKKIVDKRIFAFLTTLIFSLHPYHIDNVANLTANFDSLGYVFFLLSFYLFQLLLTTKKRKNLLLSFSLLFAACAFFSYELTLSLPFLMLVYAYYKNKKITLFPYAFYFIAAFLYIFIRTFFIHTILRGAFLPNLPEKIAGAVVAITEKLLGLVFPPQIGGSNSSFVGGLLLSQMSKETVSIHTQIFNPQFFSSIIILILVLLIGIHYYRKRSMFGFCVIWIYVSLLPVLFIALQSSEASLSQLIWDKYLFTQSWGICLMLSWIASASFSGLRKRYTFVLSLYPYILGISFTAILLIYFSATTQVNLSGWKDFRIDLLQKVMHSKESEMKHNDLGVIYASYWDLKRAVDEFSKALKINPHYEKARYNLQKIEEYEKKNHELKYN